MHVPIDSGLKDKVAIVVGGGARGDGIGNGRAACLLMAAEGARVLVVDRDTALAQRTADMIIENGGIAAAFAADVTQSSDCKTMVDRTLSLWGRVDYLDNNVGIGSSKTVVDEDEDEWDRVMLVNVKTMMLTSKHAIPAMAETGGGYLVNQRAAPAWPDRLFRQQGCCYCAVQSDGRGSRAARHPRELRGAGAGLHAHGHPQWHE
jgi:NAD(P)-dependent dehydrogenase (short-subunit alcohol dehydrogenase family)